MVLMGLLVRMRWLQPLKNNLAILREITEFPSDRKAIGSKWVFKIKYKSDGEIKRYKARLVAKGFNHKERIEFDETFSYGVKIVTVRCLVNLAMQNN
nr:ribonuclease H-like domain-containing protein [Tanacetum cinerariifolium]